MNWNDSAITSTKCLGKYPIFFVEVFPPFHESGLFFLKKMKKKKIKYRVKSKKKREKGKRKRKKNLESSITTIISLLLKLKVSTFDWIEDASKSRTATAKKIPRYSFKFSAYKIDF